MSGFEGGAALLLPMGSGGGVEKGRPLSTLVDQMERLNGVLEDQRVLPLPRTDAVGAVEEPELGGQAGRGSLAGGSHMEATGMGYPSQVCCASGLL